MHLYGELLGTSCEKMLLISVHIVIIALVGCISLAFSSWKYHTYSCNNSRYCTLTRVIGISIASFYCDPLPGGRLSLENESAGKW